MALMLGTSTICRKRPGDTLRTWVDLYIRFLDVQGYMHLVD